MVATIAAPQPTTLGQFVERHPVRAYLTLAYAICWTLFLLPLLATGGLGLLPIDVPLKPFVLLAAVLGLTLPAFVVTRATAGGAGVRAFLRHRLRWRVGVHWYLLALFGLPLACILAAPLWRGGAPLHALAAHWPLLVTTLLPGALLIAVLVSLWEETGWTGFVLPRLQDRYGPLRAVLLVNVCQAVVHLPLLFIAGGLADARIPVAQYPLYLLFLFVFTLPVRALMTWLYNATGGSLPVVAVFHGAFNVTAGATLIPTFVPGMPAGWVYGVFAVCAAVILAVTRGRLAYDSTAR
jgi:CAAX protease family protein